MDFKHLFKTNHIFPPIVFPGEKSAAQYNSWVYYPYYRLAIADKTGNSILNITPGDYLSK